MALEDFNLFLHRVGAAKGTKLLVLDISNLSQYTDKHMQPFYELVDIAIKSCKWPRFCSGYPALIIYLTFRWLLVKSHCPLPSSISAQHYARHFEVALSLWY